MLEVGTKAPDFELFDQDGKLHKLNPESVKFIFQRPLKRS